MFPQSSKTKTRARAIDYTLKIEGMKFKAFEDVGVEPSPFKLDLYGTQTLTITSDRTSSGSGFIVFYNLDTGSIYSTTQISVKPAPTI